MLGMRIVAELDRGVSTWSVRCRQSRVESVSHTGGGCVLPPRERGDRVVVDTTVARIRPCLGDEQQQQQAYTHSPRTPEGLSLPETISSDSS